jgi:hypothetical protein
VKIKMQFILDKILKAKNKMKLTLNIIFLNYPGPVHTTIFNLWFGEFVQVVQGNIANCLLSSVTMKFRA